MEKTRGPHYFSRKNPFFSEEIMMAWIFFSENQEALMLSFLSKPGVIISSGKQSMTSLFLQKKISIFV
jgi:hypothetical protein